MAGAAQYGTVAVATGTVFTSLMAVGQNIGGAGWRARLSLDARRAFQAWIVFAAAISVLVALQPERSVTHNYRDACGDWFAGRTIYRGGAHGFLYFPHAAILYAPFTLPSPWGGVLWRWVSIGGLAVCLWRLAVVMAPQSNRAAFALMTCLAIGPALASARNGQMNLPLTALVALAFVEIAEYRWRRAAAYLCLGAALNPLMIVPMAVAAVVYQPLRRPLAAGIAILLVLPFLTQRTDYVWQQYQQCLHKLFLAGNPGSENPGSDLFGILSALGYDAPLGVQTATRVAAAGMTLLLAMVATRRRRDARHAAFQVFALATCYLALCNPRMENNGFVLLGPVMGALAAEALLVRDRRVVPLLMALASLAITFSYQLTGGHNFWLCPLMAMVVWLCTIVEVLCEPASAQRELTSKKRESY